MLVKARIVKERRNMSSVVREVRLFCGKSSERERVHLYC